MVTYPFGISRRQVIRGAAAAAASTLGAPSVRAQKDQQILRFVAQADGCERVVVRCPGIHAQTLRHLGAAGVRRLVLDETAEER